MDLSFIKSKIEKYKLINLDSGEILSEHDLSSLEAYYKNLAYGLNFSEKKLIKLEDYESHKES
tara:strand:- start:119 stop:307 length:189 start_codon:yes stop_codon:yes gene_type:complete